MLPWRRAPDGVELLAFGLGFLILVFIYADVDGGIGIVLMLGTMVALFAIGWVHHRWRMRNGLDR